MTWLMIFRAHRELWAQCQELERQVSQLAEQCEKLAHRTPEDAAQTVALLREHVFAESPWPGSKVPESAWLTPAYPEIIGKPTQSTPTAVTSQ